MREHVERLFEQYPDLQIAVYGLILRAEVSGSVSSEELCSIPSFTDFTPDSIDAILEYIAGHGFEVSYDPD